MNRPTATTPTPPALPPWPAVDEDVRVALEQAWADGSWGRYDGKHGRRLAEQLGAMHQQKHVVLCSSGTLAVELALRGLQVGVGDEVILAGYDFSGNFRAIEAVGARPVVVDISPDSWCLDAGRVAEAVSEQTRAVLVSHLHGTLADMRQLARLGAQHGIAIIEDACQVPGAVVQGRIAGSWGDVSVLSFGGSKLLTAGRGGAVLTSRPEIAQRIRIYGERGNQAFPLSELQAAVLAPQLARLHQRNQLRQSRVERLLAQWPGEVPLRPLTDRGPENQPSFYKLAFLYDPSRCGGLAREALLAELQAAGVPCDSGFRGFLQRSRNRCRMVGSLTYSRRAAAQAVLLHHPILLGDPAAMDWLAAAVQRVARQLLAGGPQVESGPPGP